MSTPSPKRVLVIGGGPAGLVTARNLLERGDFDVVQLVERRDDVGGVWYLDNGDPNRNGKPRWPSPAYPNLIGNVLPEFLSFSGFPFPEPAGHPEQPFPNLSETHQYLKLFAAPLIEKGVIRLNTEVTRVEELADGQGWKVLLNDWEASEGGTPKSLEEHWDGVVVAVCWYDNPVWPDTPGLSNLKDLGIAKHAQEWRGPSLERHKGKRVLVVGNANSSNDIAAQLVSIANPPVYRSVRRTAFPGFVSLPHENIKDVPPVTSYEIDGTSTAKATLADGSTIDGIDEVQIGTGYRPYPSFIHVLDPTQEPNNKSRPVLPLMSEKISPHRIPHLHRLILYSYNPTLAFIGTTAVSYTPFTIADISSTWLSLAWSSPANTFYPSSSPLKLLESESARLAYVEKFRAETDPANPSSLYVYGVLGPYEEEYAAGLRENVVKYKPELDGVLPRWNPERTEARNAMFDTKRKALEWAKARLSK